MGYWRMSAQVKKKQYTLGMTADKTELNLAEKLKRMCFNSGVVRQDLEEDDEEKIAELGLLGVARTYFCNYCFLMFFLRVHVSGFCESKTPWWHKCYKCSTNSSKFPVTMQWVCGTLKARLWRPMQSDIRLHWWVGLLNCVESSCWFFWRKKSTTHWHHRFANQVLFDSFPLRIKRAMGRILADWILPTSEAQQMVVKCLAHGAITLYLYNDV